MNADVFEDVKDHLVRSVRACVEASSDPDRQAAWRLWESILSRPRCHKCRAEVEPGGGMCFICGTPLTKGTS